ncbi:hypothetical protein ACFYZJ_12560 [Streptomyces sp. NPDC001848]|uniref:hypothetical protein n=1 Tax=Streptomyces sp. NPDC001848 TaxID=3364618 RepID=UPI0036BC51FD
MLSRTMPRRFERISRLDVVRLSQYSSTGRNSNSTTSGGLRPTDGRHEAEKSSHDKQHDGWCHADALPQDVAHQHGHAQDHDEFETEHGAHSWDGPVVDGELAVPARIALFIGVRAAMSSSVPRPWG